MIRRRKAWVICGLAAFLLVFSIMGATRTSAPIAAVVDPHDPVGAWRLKCVPPDGKPRECVVTVIREGDALRADYTADGDTRPAKRAVFEDGHLILEVDGKFAGQAYGLTYKGAPNSDGLSGTVRWSFGWASGTFPFSGERVAEAVASAE